MYHDLARPRDIHVIHDYEFADAAGRMAGDDLNMGHVTFGELDVGKCARDLDSGDFFLLLDPGPPPVWASWGIGAVRHTLLDKRLPALLTHGDGDAAIASAISDHPVSSGYVQVFVNGHRVSVCDGPAGTGSCYFSGDGGVTKRAITNIQAGDTLHWVGSVAGYQLEVGDLIDLDYEET